MNDIIKLIIEKIQPHWDRPQSALILSFVAFVSSFVWAINTGNNAITSLEVIAIVLVTTLPFLFWKINHRIPKVSKNKIGIILSIFSENNEDAKKIENDFVLSLKQLIQKDPKKDNFEVIVLPEFASRLALDKLGAEKIRAKARGHFMIFGRVRKRHINDRDVYMFNFEGLVKHRPVSETISQELSQDFRQVIPEKMIVECKNDSVLFEVASAHIDISVRYIIGIAAYFSGDVAYSERLLLDVEGRLRQIKKVPPNLQAIAMNLSDWLKKLYQDWLIALYNGYILTKDLQLMELIDELSEKLLIRDPLNYGGSNQKAIAHFILRRDTESARELIKKDPTTKDVGWLFNKAFLYAYDGNLSEAHTLYKQALNGHLENVTLPMQCEEFISDVLKVEPKKYDLYFCLGLINYNWKKDFESAAKDFKKFVKHSPSHKDELEIANRLIKKCEAKNK